MFIGPLGVGFTLVLECHQQSAPVAPVGDEVRPEARWQFRELIGLDALLADISHDFGSPRSTTDHTDWAAPSVLRAAAISEQSPAAFTSSNTQDLRSFKVGITNLDTKRLEHFQADGWTVLYCEHFSDGSHALAVEGAIKHWWRDKLWHTKPCPS